MIRKVFFLFFCIFAAFAWTGSGANLPEPEYGERYLREVIKTFTYERNSEMGGARTYRTNVHARDMTMLLLGSYSDAWRNSPADVSNLERVAIDNLMQGRLSLPLPRNDQAHSNSLGILYSASVSYGHVASPDAIQSANLEAPMRPLYGFRVSQQVLRNAVIKEHMLRLASLKQAIQDLESASAFCHGILGRLPPNQPLPSTGVKPEHVFLQNINKTLCLSLLGQISHLKAEAQQIELQIGQLSSEYSVLNNMEKEREGVK